MAPGTTERVRFGKAKPKPTGITQSVLTRTPRASGPGFPGELSAQAAHLEQRPSAIHLAKQRKQKRVALPSAKPHRAQAARRAHRSYFRSRGSRAQKMTLLTG